MMLKPSIQKQISEVAKYMHTGEFNLAEELLEPDILQLIQIIDNAYDQEDSPTNALYQAKMISYTDLASLIDKVLIAPIKAYKSLSEIGPHLPPTEWLWENWLPKRLLTFFAAWPGAGKTYLALDIMNRIIQQLPTPDGNEFNTSQTNCIFIDGEQFTAQVYERLTAWGNSCDNVYIMQQREDQMIDLASQTDQQRLNDMVYDLKPALIIADSLGSISSKGENSVEDVRGLLSYLVKIARYSNSALIVIHHLKKGGAYEKPVTMADLRGSSHIIAMARIILTLDSFGSGPKHLRIIKSNIGPQVMPLKVDFQKNGSGYVTPHYTVMDKKPKSELQQCQAWLLNILKPGPLSYKTLKQEAELEGFSVSTLSRTRSKLGEKIVDTKKAQTKGNKWALKGYKKAQVKRKYLQKPKTKPSSKKATPLTPKKVKRVTPKDMIALTPIAKQKLKKSPPTRLTSKDKAKLPPKTKAKLRVR